MQRANRHFLPGYVWHITHRCHQRKFLFRFARDRRRYLHWLFEAKKRFGLCVLDYVVTSNHVHLVMKDTGSDVIANSLQLIAGRTAQEYKPTKPMGSFFYFWTREFGELQICWVVHFHFWCECLQSSYSQPGALQ